MVPQEEALVALDKELVAVNAEYIEALTEAGETPGRLFRIALSQPILNWLPLRMTRGIAKGD